MRPVEHRHRVDMPIRPAALPAVGDNGESAVRRKALVGRDADADRRANRQLTSGMLALRSGSGPSTSMTEMARSPSGSMTTSPSSSNRTVLSEAAKITAALSGPVPSICSATPRVRPKGPQTASCISPMASKRLLCGFCRDARTSGGRDYGRTRSRRASGNISAGERFGMNGFLYGVLSAVLPRIQKLNRCNTLPGCTCSPTRLGGPRRSPAAGIQRAALPGKCMPVRKMWGGRSGSGCRTGRLALLSSSQYTVRDSSGQEPGSFPEARESCPAIL